MLGQQRVQLPDPGDALGQLAAGQSPARLVLDFQIVMGLGLVVPDEEQPPSSSTSTGIDSLSRRRSHSDLMDQCSDGTTAHQLFDLLTTHPGTI